MWNDLNMHDRHKFIRLAVTNGVYDLDTIRSLYDKQENKYGTGGEIEVSNLPTDPNRKPIDVQPIIDRIRAERLARYTAQDYALAQIKELTDNIRENEFKREFAEWINPTRNTNNYVDIRKTVPVAEARPIFINTYEKGGPKDPPYDWTKAWQQEANKQTTAQPTSKYNVVATDGKNSNYNYEKNVIPDLSWYKDPLENTRMITEEPIEPLYGFKDPVFNLAFLGAGLANGIGRGVLSTATKATMEGLSKPITTIASQIPQLGKYSYMLPTLDKALWAATGASGLYNRVSDEGIQGITSHPFLTTMDLGMLSPVAKGIKTVGNEVMWKYTPEIPISMMLNKGVKNTMLLQEIPQISKNTRFKLGDVEINNPEMFYRQGDGNLAQDLLNSGIIRTKDTGDRVVVSGINLSKPTQSDAMFNKGKVAFNPESNMGKYLVTTMNGDKMVYTQPKTWTGNNVYVNNWRENPITLQESSGYVFDPNYGYVKLPTTEMPSYTIFNNYRNIRPTVNNDILGQKIKWENADNPLKGTLNDKDFYKEMMKYSANGYISGEPYYSYIFGKPQITKGLSKEYQENLLNNTIGRTINYLKEEKGLDEAGAKNIYDIAKQQLKDVQVGRFSKANYELAGKENFGGFYYPKKNFISLRTDIPEKQTILHEGRHMLDYNMPITLPKKHKEILNEAYGEDFINIPKTKYAGGLKDYSNMDREMVTTNLDARNKLLGNLDDLSIEQQNSIIDKANDNTIISAIESSNGYGSKYIKYLKDNGLLTKEKIQKFRNAMKYVGSFGLPTGIYLGTKNNE